jgi:hypothetical protein
MNYLVCKIEKSVSKSTELLNEFSKKVIVKICEINSNIEAYKGLDMVAFAYDCIDALTKKGGNFENIAIGYTFYGKDSSLSGDYTSALLDITTDTDFEHRIVISILNCNYDN